MLFKCLVNIFGAHTFPLMLQYLEKFHFLKFFIFIYLNEKQYMNSRNIQKNFPLSYTFSMYFTYMSLRFFICKTKELY